MFFFLLWASLCSKYTTKAEGTQDYLEPYYTNPWFSSEGNLGVPNFKSYFATFQLKQFISVAQLKWINWVAVETICLPPKSLASTLFQVLQLPPHLFTLCKSKAGRKKIHASYRTPILFFLLLISPQFLKEYPFA